MFYLTKIILLGLVSIIPMNDKEIRPVVFHQGHEEAISFINAHHDACSVWLTEDHLMEYGYTEQEAKNIMSDLFAIRRIYSLSPGEIEPEYLYINVTPFF